MEVQGFILIHPLYYPFHALTKREHLFKKKKGGLELSLVLYFTTEKSKYIKLEKIVY